VFFNFKNGRLCTEENKFSICNKPFIRNTGKLLEITDDCGYIVVPPLMNGYKCQRMEIHTPSEHKINSQGFDLELQIYFKLWDRKKVDSSTKEDLAIVVLVRGEESGGVKEHPFFKLLEIESLPLLNQGKLLNNYLDYSLLFRQSELLGDDDVILKALSEIKYDEHFPLNEFYMYNGSFTRPPCHETVTYVINSTPIVIPATQVQLFSKLILQVNPNGNRRDLQPANQREILYFKKSNSIDHTIDSLGLTIPIATDTNVRRVFNNRKPLQMIRNCLNYMIV
jgi:hypothetical protein